MNIREPQAAMRHALGVILPTADETCLLRAALHDGALGRQAWQDWLRQVGSPLTAFRGERSVQKSLLPLLHGGVVRNSVEVEPSVGSWLRAARFREELRCNAYRRILRETLVAFSGLERPPVVLKGCALSDTFYDDTNTRHSHGIELLVRDGDVERIAARLPAAGFAPARGRHVWGSGPVPLSWTHAAGLPLAVRTRLFDVPRYRGSIEDAWQQAVPLPGYAALQLGAEHALLHVLGGASCSGSRGSLRWACDAWFIVNRRREIDWGRFTALVEAHRLSLPLSVLLRYLGAELDLPVPRDVLATLDAQADATDDVGYEVALLGALVGNHAKMRRAVIAAPGWRARWAITRYLLAPSPACVREVGGGAGPWRLLAFYVTRPLLYAGRRLARLAERPGMVLPGGAESR